MNKLTDRLRAVPNPKNVSVWYLETHDGICVATIHCVVADAFAQQIVECWNADPTRKKAAKRAQVITFGECADCNAPFYDKLAAMPWHDGQGGVMDLCCACNDRRLSGKKPRKPHRH